MPPTRATGPPMFGAPPHDDVAAITGPRFTRRPGPDTAPASDAAATTSVTVIIPTFNEAATVVEAVTSVLAAAMPCPTEVIVVDDGSSDDTLTRLAALRDPRLRVLRHEVNRGKGAALLTGAQVARSTHLVPFDADLEYSPDDLPKVVQPILDGHYDVVYGARLFGVHTVYQSYRYAAGNRAMTLFANVLYDSNVTDLHTCFKVVPVDLFRALDFHERGFGLDTELTAFLLRLGIRPFEVPISYQSRVHRHGKKISWRDGVHCLRVLTRVRVSRHVFRNGHAVRLAEYARGGRSVNAVMRAGSDDASRTPSAVA